MSSPLKKSAIAAAVFAVVGFTAGGVLSFGSTASGSHWVEWASVVGVAVYISAIAVWWGNVVRSKNFGAAHGASAGAAIGVLIHPVTWYALICWNWIAVTFMGRPHSAAGDPMNPVDGLLGAVGFSCVSVILAGWITVPACALIGASVARSQNRNDNGAGSSQKC